MTSVRVAVVGDFDRKKRSHWATEAALFHAGAALGVRVEPRWIATESVATADAAHRLRDHHAIWGAPGSPYVSMDGILNAIRYAREHDVPYLGTCAGFQYAVIEFSRHVLGITDADSAENRPEGKNIVIRPVQCAMPESPSEPRLAGPGIARPTPQTLLEALCGSDDLTEEYFCSLEVDSKLVPMWQEAGLVVAARGVDGELRALELPKNRFFLATLFQPQLSSSLATPHPLIKGLLRASLDRQVAVGV